MVTKNVHRAPTQDEIYSYRMQVSSDENYDRYRINLGFLSEDQKRQLVAHYGISLGILEDETSLTLIVMKEY
jgi:hypothetical protein